MNCMKHEMQQWDRDREWLARRFMAGWVCALLCPTFLIFGMHWSGVAVGVVGLGLLWSTRR